MGIRLYVSTHNQKDIEEIAGVEPGTYDIMEDLKRSRSIVFEPEFSAQVRSVPENQFIDMNYEIYRYKKTKYPDVSKLEKFMLYGYGKLTDQARYIIDTVTEHVNCVNGCTTDKDRICQILGAQGILLDNEKLGKIKEVYWC